MNRGEVYKTKIQLPHPRRIPFLRESRWKYVVVLRGGAEANNDLDVPFVVASSKRRTGPLRAFEVEVGPGDEFRHATVIDCRWVYTVPKAELHGPARLTLPQDVMEQIDVALVVGLQMG